MTDAARTDKGQFVKGISGNPDGRPKGSKNQMTLLRQSLEFSLREQSKDVLPEILQAAMDLALAGDRSMIKLLLELHMTKSVSDEREATDKVSITIGTHAQGQPPIQINGETHENTIEADTSSHSGLPDSNKSVGDTVLGGE